MMQTAMAAVTTTTFSYEADQWRIEKISDSGTTYFARGSHGELLAEWQDPAASGWTLRDYIYIGSQLIASVAR